MKIAIVFPSGHFFDTPCIPNLAKSLAEKSCKVDVYIAKNLATPSGRLEHENLSIKFFPITFTKAKENIKWLMAGFFFWFGSALLKNRYDYIIACGIRSLFLVGVLSLIFRIKYIYNSLEIYSDKRFSSFFGKTFKLLESYFNNRALSTIIQDNRRAEILQKVNSLERHNFLIFPNSPFVNNQYQHFKCDPMPSSKKEKFKKKFGISQRKRVVLYSGSLTAEWTGFKKIIRVVHRFPEDWILFLQSRDMQDKIILKNLEPLIKEGKVFYSLKPLSSEDYNEFIAEVDVGLAWYEGEEENIKYVGLSSGKIAHYLFKGKPIIVNLLPKYEEICNKYRCGFVVDHVNDIPDVLNIISQNYAAFSAGAYTAYADLFDLDKYINTIVNFLHKYRQ